MAVDIGGTFTDIVIVERTTGRSWTAKCLNTPKDLSVGILAGIRRVLNREGLGPEEFSDIVHGTTLATNALIERTGARTALVTTKGFRDLLQIRREQRHAQYDLQLDVPDPLVPRELRFEAEERIDRDGRILTPLTGRQLELVLDRVARADVESIAICFLHSYKNPSHEAMLGEALRARVPDVDVSASFEVLPEIREYERMSTTVINAYVKPKVRTYMSLLEAAFRDMGLGCPIFVMLSNGGTATTATAAEFPVRMVESGPAAGVLAATYYGQVTGENDLLAFDMGGTTAKMSLIDALEPLISTQLEIARLDRLQTGSGLPVSVPSVELIEIGAGGGSIARIDQLGLLKVGPASAGAEPGPACYGLGGLLPTVTDADVVLGYIDPDNFAGGLMPLDVNLATKALTSIATYFGGDSLQAAAGIFEVVNDQMSSAANIHIVERGRDPQKYTLVATGGAGPIHAYELARRLHLRRIVIPYGAGIGSAFGLLVAPKVFDFTRTLLVRLNDSDVDWREVNNTLSELEKSGREIVHRSGPGAQIETSRTADLRYTGQGFEVTIKLPDGPLGPNSIPELTTEFERAYRQLYGHIPTASIPLEVMTWRARVSTQPDPVRPVPPASVVGSGAVKGRRLAYFPQSRGMEECAVMSHSSLAEGERFRGPCLVEQDETTAVVGPSAEVLVGRDLHLLVMIDET